MNKVVFKNKMHAMSGISLKNLHIFCIILMLIATSFARAGPAEDRKMKIDKEDDLETSASAYYSYPGSFYNYGGYYPYGRFNSYGYPGYYGGYGGYGYGFGGYYPSYFGFY